MRAFASKIQDIVQAAAEQAMRAEQEAVELALRPLTSRLSRLALTSSRWAEGRPPYKRIIPKAFTGRKTLPGTNGSVELFDPEDFGNNAEWPFVLESIMVYDESSTSTWRVAVQDRDSGYYLLGKKGRTISTVVDGKWFVGPDWQNNDRNAPTVRMIEPYRVEPEGGFNVYTQSVGTATVAVAMLKGYWIVEP